MAKRVFNVRSDCGKELLEFTIGELNKHIKGATESKFNLQKKIMVNRVKQEVAVFLDRMREAKIDEKLIDVIHFKTTLHLYSFDAHGDTKLLSVLIDDVTLLQQLEFRNGVVVWKYAFGNL
jgi:hypothetical protein